MPELKVLISEEDVLKRVKELGTQISKDYEGKSLTVIGVLKGSFLFQADLVRYIDVPVQVDFLEVSSYGNETKSSGVVKFVKDLTHSIEGLDVLIVEDIIDSGLTMNYLLNNLKTRNPASLKVCTLLEKPHKTEVPIDYTGFKIEDKFVVGYGLDYRGFYRNTRYIGYFDNP
ncbi:MAG: hypoxanthine phosphoribosyltransferase [Pseudomonadota bacterium]